MASQYHTMPVSHAICIGILSAARRRYAGMPWLRFCLSIRQFVHRDLCWLGCVRRPLLATRTISDANQKGENPDSTIRRGELQESSSQSIFSYLKLHSMSQASYIIVQCLSFMQVNSAQAVIDATCPPHQPHVSIKSKKLQKERERLAQIERENRRLLRKLSQIMITNRVENYWKDPHPK